MSQKLVSRTHFRRSQGRNLKWQWFWSKEAPNGQVIAVGGEGYDEPSGARNGFFSSEGFSDWQPGQGFPAGYKLAKFAEDHYTICKYEDVEDTTFDNG